MEQNESEIASSLEKSVIYLLAELIILSLKFNIFLSLRNIVASDMGELTLSFFSSINFWPYIPLIVFIISVFLAIFCFFSFYLLYQLLELFKTDFGASFIWKCLEIFFSLFLLEDCLCQEFAKFLFTMNVLLLID